MTLLNTVANLGGSWPQPTVLWLVQRSATLAKCYSSGTRKSYVEVGSRQGERSGKRRRRSASGGAASVHVRLKGAVLCPDGRATWRGVGRNVLCK